VQDNDSAMNALLDAARTGGDAGISEGGASLSAESLRAIAALLRLDPAYGAVVRQRAVLDHEASGLRLTSGSLNDIRQQLATTGGVRPAQEDKPSDDERAKDARESVDGVRRMISDLEGSLTVGGAQASQLQPLKEELNQLQTRVNAARTATTVAAANAVSTTGGKDLPDLIRQDEQVATTYAQPIETARTELAHTESVLAKDSLRRVDLRLSRLLRRARLGRIESILGRKRSLEIEIEAINNGFLKDSEEYWPFEGDDWPDEFIGSEGLK
jgi:hypothetical protein